MQQAYFQTKLGWIKIVEEEEKIIRICYEEPKGKQKEAESNLIQETEKQIKEYLEGKREKFSIPIRTKGTTFQKRVWDELLQIPYGETISYEELACRIGKPKAARAVGMANHKNPISILIPCHRVIGKNKKLIGYAGGIERKERLIVLEKEKRNFKNAIGYQIEK